MRQAKVIDRVSTIVHQADPTAKVILYGSQARGTARPDSDVDLLILVSGDSLSVKREQQYTTPLYRLEWETGVQINPMVMLQKDWEHQQIVTPFYLNVKREGVVI